MLRGLELVATTPPERIGDQAHFQLFDSILQRGSPLLCAEEDESPVARMPSAKSCSVIEARLVDATARRNSFSSSRTLPGQA